MEEEGRAGTVMVAVVDIDTFGADFDTLEEWRGENLDARRGGLEEIFGWFFVDTIGRTRSSWCSLDSRPDSGLCNKERKKVGKKKNETINDQT